MWEVLAGGVIALTSGWLLDGGTRRRVRRTIREELELADLVPDTRLAGELQARAYARAEKYLGPSVWSQVLDLRHSLVRIVPFLALLAVGFAVLNVVTPDDASSSERLLGGLLVGVVVSLVWNVLGLLRESRAVEQRTIEQVEEVTATLEATRAAVKKYNQRVFDAAAFARRPVDSSGVSDERLAEMGITREEYEGIVTERRVRAADEGNPL